MKRNEVDQIKKFLTGAGGRRLEEAEAAKSVISERLPSKEGRCVSEKILESTLNPSTPKQLASILAKEQARLNAELKESRARAIKNSRATLKVLNAAAAQIVKGFEAVAEDSPTDRHPYYEFLNTPLMILSTDNLLVASEIAPSNSYARFFVGPIPEDDDFYGNVSFYYSWSNPKNKFAVINVNGYIIFNFFCVVGALGGLTPLPRSRFGHVEVYGQLNILEYWNQPPTSPLIQPDQVVEAVRLSCSGNWGCVDSKHVFRGYDLSHNLMVVPPSGIVLFRVTASVGCVTGVDGFVKVDFGRQRDSGLRLGSPGVLVTVLS